MQQPRCESDSIQGQLFDHKSGDPLPGYAVSLLSESVSGDRATIARAFSQLDGWFEIAQLPDGSSGQRYELAVQNPFGHDVACAGPLTMDELLQEQRIAIELKPEQQRPVPLAILDPFETLRDAYTTEMEALARAGVTSGEQLSRSDLKALSERTSVPLARLESLKLHGELNEATGTVTADAVRLLVAAGIKRRADLAAADRNDVARAIGNAIARHRVPMGDFSPQDVPNWIAVARGWNPAGLVQLSAESTRVVRDNLFGVVARSNPRTGLNRDAIVVLSQYWAQLDAIAEMRAILSTAGVYDLSALGPFLVRGQQRIGPGYHFSLPHRVAATVADVSLLSRIAARGAAFSKVQQIRYTNYGIHIVPNPVTDAVILGSLIRYIDNGQLIIGRDVTRLIIVTDEIVYGQLNRIGYEGAMDSPPPQPKAFPWKAGPPRAMLNDRHVYRPDLDVQGNRLSDNGANGLRGVDGIAGIPGYGADAAPSIKVYVRNTPAGIPDIDLNGRPGGRGGDGQDGGDGEDGAKGRESTGSFWVACVSEVGHGGGGGNGGMGGMGGMGGSGGRAGDIEIYTANPASLLARYDFFLGTTGGRGGDGGTGGSGGARGIGGDAGHDTAGCDAHPEWHGPDGMPGAQGAGGPSGAQGGHGNVSLVPITLDQFNAAFHYPFLQRLEPSSGPPGTKVTVVGLNLTDFGDLYFDKHPVAKQEPDTVNGKVKFTVPEDSGGGLKQVVMRLPLSLPAVPGLDSNASNPLGFRVTPLLDSISPPQGVPGMELVLHGAGFVAGTVSSVSPNFFVNGSQVRFGGLTLPLVIPKDTKTGDPSTTTAILKLPFWEDINLPAGPQTISVVNPDGSESNPITFDLSLEYSLRVKVWRVYADGFVAGGGGLFGGGPLGTDRPLDEIRDLMGNDENSPVNLWKKHHIQLVLDPNIENAYFPSAEADSFPHGNDPIMLTKLNPGSTDNRSYFVADAINFYFVSDIDDATTNAFSETVGAKRLPTYVVYEDTASLSTAREALVASHEVGHLLGLPHVCAKDEDEDASTTLFGRLCIKPDILHTDATPDMDYLMYPNENFIYTTKGVVLEQEAIAARRGALQLMQPTRVLPPGI